MKTPQPGSLIDDVQEGIRTDLLIGLKRLVRGEEVIYEIGIDSVLLRCWFTHRSIHQPYEKGRSLVEV
jgi:hypothetical protein